MSESATSGQGEIGVRTLEQEWAGYKKSVYPNQIIPPGMELQLKMAFFAGALKALHQAVEVSAQFPLDGQLEHVTSIINEAKKTCEGFTK